MFASLQQPKADSLPKLPQPIEEPRRHSDLMSNIGSGVQMPRALPIPGEKTTTFADKLDEQKQAYAKTTGRALTTDLERYGNLSEAERETVIAAMRKTLGIPQSCAVTLATEPGTGKAVQNGIIHGELTTKSRNVFGFQFDTGSGRTWVQHGGTSDNELQLKQAEGAVLHHIYYSDLIRWNDRTDPRWDVTNEKKKEVLAAFEEAFELKAGSLTKIDTFWDRKFNVVEGYAGDKRIFSYPSRPRVR